MRLDDTLYRAYLEELKALDAFGRDPGNLEGDARALLVKPDVRRIMEAMALLSARTRLAAKRQEQVTRKRMLQQFFPHLMNPVPSMAMVRVGAARKPEERISLPRGTEVELSPESGGSAVFRTLQKLEVHSFEMAQPPKVVDGGKRLLLCLKNLLPGNPGIGRLPLFVNHLGDYKASLEIHGFLTRHLKTVTAFFDREPAHTATGTACPFSFGMEIDPDDGRHPIERERHFFHFPWQDLYLNARIDAPEAGWKECVLCLDLDCDWPTLRSPASDLFQLSTVPVMNFREDMASPVIFDGTRDACAIHHPDVARGFESHSVRGVFEVTRDGMQPLRAALFGDIAPSWEAEVRTGANGARRQVLNLNHPAAFEKARTIAIRGGWFQPWFSACLGQRIAVASHAGSARSLNWQIAVDPVGHADSPMAGDLDVYLRFFTLMNREKPDRNAVLDLSRALGISEATPFGEVLPLVDEVRLKELPGGSGGGARHVCAIALQPFGPELAPLVSRYLDRIRTVLAVWLGDVMISAVTATEARAGHGEIRRAILSPAKDGETAAGTMEEATASAPEGESEGAEEAPAAFEGRKTHDIFLATQESFELARQSYMSRYPNASLDREDKDFKRIADGLAFFSARNRAVAEKRHNGIFRRMFQQKYPFFTTPLPSMAMLTATPTGMLAETVSYPKGSEFALVPESGGTAIFRTMQDVRILPVKMEAPGITTGEGGNARLLIPMKGRFARNCEVGPFPIFVNQKGSFTDSLALHGFLSASVTGATVIFDGTPGEDGAMACPVSFGGDAAVTAGMHPLEQERNFFHFPWQDLQMEVDVPDPGTRWKDFEIALDLNGPWPHDRFPISEESFQAFTIPVVNSCVSVADPVTAAGSGPIFDLTHPDMEKGFVVQSVNRVFEATEAGLCPVDPGMSLLSTPSWEMETVTDATGSVQQGLSVNFPGAPNVERPLVVEANWMQPWVSTVRDQPMEAVPFNRVTPGVEWGLAVPPVAPTPAVSPEDTAMLSGFLSQSGKGPVDRASLESVMAPIGVTAESPFAPAMAKVADVQWADKVVQVDGSGTLVKECSLTITPHTPEDAPMVSSFSDHAFNVLDGLGQGLGLWEDDEPDFWDYVLGMDGPSDHNDGIADSLLDLAFTPLEVGGYIVRRAFFPKRKKGKKLRKLQKKYRRRAGLGRGVRVSSVAPSGTAAKQGQVAETGKGIGGDSGASGSSGSDGSMGYPEFSGMPDPAGSQSMAHGGHVGTTDPAGQQTRAYPEHMPAPDPIGFRPSVMPSPDPIGFRPSVMPSPDPIGFRPSVMPTPDPTKFRW